MLLFEHILNVELHMLKIDWVVKLTEPPHP